MIYAKTAKEIETRRKSFIRKWRLKCRAVADSLEDAGMNRFGSWGARSPARVPRACGDEPRSFYLRLN